MNRTPKILKLFILSVALCLVWVTPIYAGAPNLSTAWLAPSGDVAPGSDLLIMVARMTCYSPSCQLDGLRLRAMGTGDELAGVESVRVWLDTANGSFLVPSDALLGESIFDADDGVAAVTFTSPVNLNMYNQQTLLIEYRFSPNAPEGTYKCIFESDLEGNPFVGQPQSNLLMIHDTAETFTPTPTGGIPTTTPTMTLTATSTVTSSLHGMNFYCTSAGATFAPIPDEPLVAMSFRGNEYGNGSTGWFNFQAQVIGTAGVSAAVTQVQFWRDTNQNGQLDGGDVVVSTQGLASNGEVGLSDQMPSRNSFGAYGDYLVTFAFSDQATGSYGISIISSSQETEWPLSQPFACNGNWFVVGYPTSTPTWTQTWTPVLSFTPTPTRTWTGTPTSSATWTGTVNTMTPTITWTSTVNSGCCYVERTMGSQGNGTTQINGAGDVVVSGGDVWVGDLNNARLQVYDTDGNFQRSMTLTASLPPQHMALDNAGNLFILTSQGFQKNRLSDGALLGSSTVGSGLNVGVDDSGNVWISQSGGRVLKYRETGSGTGVYALVGQIGSSSTGSGPDQLSYYPEGCKVVGDAVYICDSNNSRIQKFVAASPGGDAYLPAGSMASNMGVSPHGMSWTGTGFVYVACVNQLRMYDARVEPWIEVQRCVTHNAYSVAVDPLQRPFVAGDSSVLRYMTCPYGNPTAVPTPTGTWWSPTFTRTATPPFTWTPSASPTPSRTPSVTSTRTVTPTWTDTTTTTATPSGTWYTATPSFTATWTPTFTPYGLPTLTGTYTATSTYSRTPTGSPTPTPSVTSTPTSIPTGNISSTPTLTTTCPIVPTVDLTPCDSNVSITLYETESPCESGLNDTCSSAQTIMRGFTPGAGFQLVGYLSSESDADYYSFVYWPDLYYSELFECMAPSTNDFEWSFENGNCGINGVNSYIVKIWSPTGSTGPYKFSCYIRGTMVPTPTSTSTISSADTPTLTPTPSATRTSTWTPTASWSATRTPTWTFSWTPTNTPMPTSSTTSTWTSTPTWTPTASWSATWTPTTTMTPTQTSSPTWTHTPTMTWTPTASATDTPAYYVTHTAVPTATATTPAIVPAVLAGASIVSVIPYPNPSKDGAANLSFDVAGTVVSSSAIQASTSRNVPLASDATVTLRIYSRSGRLLWTHRMEEVREGSNLYHWNGRDFKDAPLANGLYYYTATLERGGHETTKRAPIVILK